MNKLLRHSRIILPGLLLTVVLPFVQASQEDAYRLRQQNLILPLSDIIARAQSLHPGELLEAELETLQGRYVYEIELYGEDGHYYELYFDAKTGDPVVHGMERREE